VRRFLVALMISLGAPMFIAGTTLAWDSGKSNPTHPTHSYLTEFAIDALAGQYPELETFRVQLIEGANTELHELPVSGTAYGLDLDAKRIEHHGTNEGSDDVEGWWTDAVEAYAAGETQRAYFLVGVMLHMIEDMGVPAHANRIYHQGTPSEFDNFEFLALSNWKPSFAQIDKADPGYDEPWRYYRFSEAWTREDAPGYRDTGSFSKFWLTASDAERQLLSNRQGRTATVVQWALAAAARTLGP
jgi:hypothetical protein